MDSSATGRAIAATLADLEALGVALWVEGTQLRYRSPKGVLTPERLAWLREHRSQVTELLTRPEPVSVHPDTAGRYEPFPLTDVQHAYLVGRGGAYPYGGVGCHGYGELRFDDLDPARLDKAWAEVVRRHDMLRATVTADGTQRVLRDPPPYGIAIEDVRGEAAFAQAVERTRAALDHRVYQPGDWPLFDLRLTVGEAYAVLHFSIDFLIADFVSLRILLDELATVYRDPGATPPEPGLTYRDALLADRLRRTGAAYERDRAYWWDRLAELPERPDLPTRLDPGAPPRFRRHLCALSSAEWTALRQRAAQARLTPTAAVLTAYAEVVGRWCRHPRFTLNVTVLNRPPVHPAIDRVVGDFTAVELLAVDARRNGPFAERARATQTRLWADLDHGLVTGIDVVRELRRRDPDAPTLFPIVFTSSIGLGPDGSGEADSEGRLVHGISQTPQVWLDCQVLPAGGGLSVNWDVRDGVFPPGLVETMFAAFETLLRELAAGESPWEATAPVPVPADQLARRPVLSTVDEPPRSLVDAVTRQIRRTPERTAIVTPDTTVSYGDLGRRAGAVAEALRSQGCTPGTLVAIELDQGWEQVAAVLGVLAAGCAYVPVDREQPVARRDRVIADAGVRHVLREPVPAGDASFEHRAEAGDLAYVIYTSGSTGTPKGVAMTHAAAWNTVADINRRFAVGPDDKVFGLSSLGFDLSVYDIVGPLSVGGQLVVPAAGHRADPGHWAGLLDRTGVTVWNSVPGQLAMLVSYLRGDPAVRLDALRLALLSGDWIPVTLPGEVWDLLPDVRLVSLGGATEAAIWSIVHPISTVDSGRPSIPYGRPLSGQSVDVLDDDLAPVPDLVPGELYIGGAGLAAGYHGDLERTAARFVRHPLTGQRLYRTGDVGRYLPDGGIELLGRDDAQVKIRGHRVEPGEVRAALESHPSVGAAAVVPYGERPEPVRLAAFVVPATRVDPVDGPTAAHLGESALHAAAGVRAQVDDAQMLAFADELDVAGRHQMLAALRSAGLFPDGAAEHTVPEILERARVAPRHHRLVRRWLGVLQGNGLLRPGPTGGLSATVHSDRSTVDAAWRRIAGLVPDAERRTELLTYFRTAADHLPALLRGEQDPLELLFPEGRTEIHEVAYTAMFLSRYLNRLLTHVATELAARHADGPFRVLEVGAGVGGTSVELIPALAEHPVEYLFTDVSGFFLNNARDRFGRYPWVDYRRYDLNVDHRPQGLPGNGFELVVCANVLHYAKSVDATLTRLTELLAPGGWLLFIEATRDSHQIMTSMEFLFDEGSGDFDDVRAKDEQTFLTRPQWMEALARAGAHDAVCLPDVDPVTDRMGMQVFAARFKTDRRPVRRESLERHLREQVPAHMLPSELQVVDRLPVTANGKVDQRTLRSWLSRSAGSADTADEPPRGALEEALALVWQRLLRVERVGRHRNFFELGGDSLLAAQVAGAVRETLPAASPLHYDNLLRLLLENATVAALAARIEAEPTPTPVVGTATPLVRLGDGDGPTLVLVHDDAGTLGGLRPLLDSLPPGTPLVGLRVPEPETFLATPAPDLFDTVAGEYARALVTAGLTTIRLYGQHLGAVLAAEVARQLGEVGVRVERLVLVAPPPPDFPHPSTVDDELARHTGTADRRLLPYAGDVTLLRPESGSPDGLVDYWAEVCLGDLTVVDVPGDWTTCVPEAAPVAADLLTRPAAAAP